jgi:hypothetical protein
VSRLCLVAGSQVRGGLVRSDNAPVSVDAARPIRRLDIRVGVPDVGDDDYAYPVARLLIDGHDVLAAVGTSQYVPWPAHEMLTEDAPLLAADLPRCILYVQSPDPCGLAARISSDGEVVAWNDFQHICEAGDDPLDLQHAYSLSPVAFPDLIFDARQYTAEVNRATAKREWESDSWKTAVLLHAYLRDYALTPGEEWEGGLAEPDGEYPQRYRITYWTEDLQTVATVSLTAAPGTPEHQARTMHDYLRATPTARWPIIRDAS